MPHDPPIGGALWVHALSVGEVISALPLLRALKRRFPQKQIVFTVTTTQGLKIARESIGGEINHILPMPLDFWWSANRIIRFTKPSLFVLVETDLWPGLIFSLKRRGVKTILVNGRISPGTYRSYKLLRCMVRRLINAMEICMVQTVLDQRRLRNIGVKAEKILTVGNLKFDQDRPPMKEEETDAWLDLLNLKKNETVWIAGSTHPGEEAVILRTFKKLRDSFPELRLIIAPRRIERSDEIFRLSEARGLKTLLRTEISRSNAHYNVLVLNTIGELGRLYGIGKISFVGGSLAHIGGHNLLEPAAFGHPVLFGPHTQNFDLMSKLLIQTGGGLRIHDSESLFIVLKDLLNDSEKSEAMGKNAREFVEAHRGALKRILDFVDDCLSDSLPVHPDSDRSQRGRRPRNQGGPE